MFERASADSTTRTTCEGRWASGRVAEALGTRELDGSFASQCDVKAKLSGVGVAVVGCERRVAAAGKKKYLA